MMHSPATAHPTSTGLRDPVCGMSVSADTEFRTEHAGREYLFCSRGCQDRFQANTARYIPRTPTDRAESSEEGRRHPYDPAPQDHPSGRQAVGAPLPCPDETYGSGVTNYSCPMHPEVRQGHPGACPKCGMALEPESLFLPETRTEYTCPMHPEIVQDRPGSCPKCGMALEPRTVTAEEKNEELIDMTRRLWVSTALALPLFVLAMVADLAPGWLHDGMSMRMVQWIEFALATPVVLWGGWPFFVRGWQSVLTWNLNMFTLIGLGVAVAWGYSLVALLIPQVFPSSMRMADGIVHVYFEAAAMITALVLLGQVLELRAREHQRRHQAAARPGPQYRPPGA